LFLNSRKEYFEEPIVRAKADKIHFPNICPVCCEPATEMSIMAATYGNRERYYEPPTRVSYMRLGAGAKGKETKFFRVPVCANHYISEDEDHGGHKAYCITFDVIGIALVFFALIMASHDFRLGRPIPSWVSMILIIFVIMLAMTRFVFNINPLESSIRIIGFDKNMINVWFEFQNHEYRDKFIEENPMNAELVKWIIRA
jgi:hypothetical protein